MVSQKNRIVFGRRGVSDVSNQLNFQVLAIILVLIFAAIVSAFLYSQLNSAGIWEDYYANELARVVDVSEPGDVLEFEINKAVEIALKNEVGLENLFTFDNSENAFCVKLSRSGSTCKVFFRDVALEQMRVKLAEPENVLIINVGVAV